MPNGDTLVIMGNVASGPPPEKRITLASLVAPRLVRAVSPPSMLTFGREKRTHVSNTIVFK